MSVNEQWAAYSEQHTDTRASLCERDESYKGFALRASTKPLGNGFSMSVRITRYSEGSVKEVVQTPAWNINRFSNAEAALDALIVFGCAIVDREVPGVDVSALFS